jgi:hypothetical protein
LIDLHGDGSEYILRIEAAANPNPETRIVLEANDYPPQLRIAEVKYINPTETKKVLDFIGTEDIRMGLHIAARAVRRADETFGLIHENGNIIFWY